MKVDIMVEKSILLHEELTGAVEADNHQEQWRIIENLRRVHASASDDILELLVNERIHPVNKTAIINF
ncbi:hypothetical protein CV093_12795 [Oceanobacillus sp. 143]|nr:hypothetical protein CV093_12795 [Oceanobacillus sp. 143]